MTKKIIKIDEQKCIGCGLCVKACQQDAIRLVNKKATMVREDYCDGLGNCLPVCPVDAISFEEGEIVNKKIEVKPILTPCMMHSFENKHSQDDDDVKISSKLRNWPIQIKLAPTNATFLDGQSLLISADCCAYAYANFHNEIMKGKMTLLGCPKLDDTDYSIKLSEIIKNNNIKDITLARMEVPCCGGLQVALKKAIELSEKDLALNIITITRDGSII